MDRQNHNGENTPLDAMAIFGADTGIEESHDSIKRETALWRAVITQALMDAGSQSKKPEAIADKKKAIKWLTEGSEDFVAVCLNANLNPQYVREQSIKAIERGCVWRNGMAEKRNVQPQNLQTKQRIIFTQPLSYQFPAQKDEVITMPCMPAIVHSQASTALH